MIKTCLVPLNLEVHLSPVNPTNEKKINQRLTFKLHNMSLSFSTKTELRECKTARTKSVVT